MTSNEGLASFIGSSFRSIWTLEALCYLRQSSPVDFSQEELIAALRASESIVRQSVAELCAAGLTIITTEGRVRYAPVSSDLDRLAAATQARYASAPNAVRRIIVRSANQGLAAFADAFRLKDNP